MHPIEKQANVRQLAFEQRLHSAPLFPAFFFALRLFFFCSFIVIVIFFSAARLHNSRLFFPLVLILICLLSLSFTLGQRAFTIPVSSSKPLNMMSPPSSATDGRMRVSSSSLMSATTWSVPIPGRRRHAR